MCTSDKLGDSPSVTARHAELGTAVGTLYEQHAPVCTNISMGEPWIGEKHAVRARLFVGKDYRSIC